MTITPFVAAKKITTEKRTTTTIPINSRKQYLWCFAERLHCDIVCADWHSTKSTAACLGVAHNMFAIVSKSASGFSILISRATLCT